MSDAPTKLQLNPLHIHTLYSVLDGASGIDEYLKWCVENGAPALGITDHGWQIGALELVDKAKKKGIIPLPGCEFYVAPDKDHIFSGKPYDYYHVTAWAINEKGYRNLIKLGSLSFNKDQLFLPVLDKEKGTFSIEPKKRVVNKMGNPKPRITIDELLTHNEGIILGSGCLIGLMSKCWLQKEWSAGEKNLMRLMEVYKDRLYVELMPHCVSHDYDRTTKSFKHNECNDWSPDGDVQKSVNLKNIEIARKFNLPLLMTTDAHFVKPEQKPLQDCLLQNGDPDGWKFYNTYSALTTEQAWDFWKAKYGDTAEQRKIFAEGVENTHAISDAAKGLKIVDDYKQPHIDIPQDILSKTSNQKEALKLMLIRKIEEHKRMDWNDPKYMQRLKTELDIICDNGQVDFARYFLFLEQWGKWSRDHSILSAPGRGSGAGSLLCYLLKITHLDPFKYNLPFERFLSQGRINRKKYPDIDWDISYRDPLIAKLNEVYGDHIAQCSTLGTLKIKSAIKDACRVILGWNSNDDQVNGLTRTIDDTPQGVADKDFLLGYKDQDGNEHEGLLDTNLALKEFFDKYPAVFDMVLQLLGIPRSVGRHASAFLVSDRPIYESVPTCYIGDQLCTQYNAQASNNYVEKAGLIKFDFLSVITLRFIANAVRLAQRSLGHKVWNEKIMINNEEYNLYRGEMAADMLPMPDGRVLDMYNLPEDPAVFNEISEGHTQSLFQISSNLLTAYCLRIKPKSIMDLSDIVALIRPGPLKALIEDGVTTMAEAYIKRRDKEMAVTYPRAEMKPYIGDTNGVAVYQEQLQAMFQHLLGYTAEEADELREVLAKKKKQELEKRVPEIRQRCRDKGWSDIEAASFVSLCIASSQYSFNRAHSASYGTVAYQCAFLKHHFPLEWWTAVLQSAKIEDMKEKGYIDAVKDILQMPHVNGPTDTFDLDGGKIHAPLYLIEDIGDAACKAILDERNARGPYTSFQNFFERVNLRMVNKAVMNNLIICDAFQYIEPNRSYRELLSDYHYFRRVRELKIGKEKYGDELVEAVKKYKELEVLKQESLDIPELHDSPSDIEIKRIGLLPIYKTNVLDKFQLRLSKILSYGPNEVLYRTKNGDSIRVLRTTKEVERFCDDYHGRTPCIWVGLVQEQKTFKYTDKKSGKEVTALKLHITNDGDSIECILWPDLYQEKKDHINAGKIVLCNGTMKASREPGKFSMSVMQIAFV